MLTVIAYNHERCNEVKSADTPLTSARWYVCHGIMNMVDESAGVTSFRRNYSLYNYNTIVW